MDMSHCIPRLPWFIAGRSDLHLYKALPRCNSVSSHTHSISHLHCLCLRPFSVHCCPALVGQPLLRLHCDCIPFAFSGKTKAHLYLVGWFIGSFIQRSLHSRCTALHCIQDPRPNHIVTRSTGVPACATQTRFKSGSGACVCIALHSRAGAGCDPRTTTAWEPAAPGGTQSELLVC
jgi:hypothetical protein